MMMRLAAMATLFGLACSTPAFAQVYQCRDANGKVSYTDAPCTGEQQGRVVERPKTPEEIRRERAQADEALDRKFRDQQTAREQQRLDFQQEHALQHSRAGRTAADLASTPQCRQAQKDMDFVSSIRTLNDDERRVRINAEITKVNAACGTNTPLMQEPPRVIVHPDPQPRFQRSAPRTQ